MSYTKDPLTNKLRILEENHYYPFGLKHSVYNTGKMKFREDEENGDMARPVYVYNTDYQYKFGAKEWQDELGLNIYDFEARLYDPALGRWSVIDPLAEIARRWSPYTYAVNNPIYFIDPDGMKIDPGSQAEWDSQRKSIEDRRNELQTKVDGLNEKAAKNGWSAEKLANKIGDLGDRIASLDGTLNTMNVLADVNNSQVYEVKTVSGDKGGLTMDPSTGNITIGFLGTTDNFVHETTHAGQFESGDIAFTDKGNVLGQDLFDETSAYKAEAGYSGSVFGKGINGITNNFMTTLTDSGGNKVYGVGGSSNSGLDKITTNSTVFHLIKAYPAAAEALKQYDKNTKLRDLPGVVTKK